MTSHWRTGQHSALIATVLFYVLLPYLGMGAWHAFVPEHDHWFVGSDMVERFPAPIAADVCADCIRTPAGETVVHAFNPLTALQLFSIVFALSSSLALFVPHGLVMRWRAQRLFLTSASLVPLDPPPMVA